MLDDSAATVVSDIEARQAALDISQSFCVSAPAGSGKTELLIQRILKLLAGVEEPERVVAITFTRKAAAEMRERLQAALDEAMQVESGALTLDAVSAHRRKTLELAGHTLRHSRERNWQLDYQSTRLKIQTFDGLCNAIANSEPLASKMGGGLRPTDNASSLYVAAVEQYFTELQSSYANSEGNASVDVDDLSRLLQYFYNRQSAVKKLLVNMLSLREHWLPHINTLVEAHSAQVTEQALSSPLWDHLSWAMNATICDSLGELRRHLQSGKTFSLASLIEVIDYARENFQRNDYQDVKSNSALAALQDFATGELPGTELSGLQGWLAIGELFFTRDLTARKQLTKAQGFPANAQFKGEALEHHKLKKQQLTELANVLADDASITRTVARVQALPQNGFSSGDQTLLVNIAKCLQRLSAYLQLQFLETGLCDHAEVQAAALRALGSDTAAQAQDIEYRWHRTVEHLLVDEFQDTSVSQFRLIEALTRNWDEADLGEGKRSLFVVGDGMQSIYGFREANVGLFLRAAETGIGHIHLEQLRLTHNFRSTDPIVNWVNALFTQTFPAHANASIGAVPYVDSCSSSPASETDLGVVLEVIAENAAIEDVAQRNQEARAHEARRVAARIKRLQSEDPNGTVAVLLRNRSHAGFLIDAFQAQGIAWQGVDLAPLKSREAVLDILSLYRAVSNLADDIAWWALVRAPWCGLRLVDMQCVSDVISSDGVFSSIAELLLAASAEDIASIEGLSEDASLRLQFLCSAIQLFWRNRARQPLRQNLSDLWQRLGGKLIASVSALEGQISSEQSSLKDDSDSAEAMFALIEQHEAERVGQSGTLNTLRLEDRLEKLYAQPAESTGDTPAIVQIMTMHKSKGLEFDSVVLPGLARGSGRSDAPILYSREMVFTNGREGVLIAPKAEQPLFAKSFARKPFAKEHGRGDAEKGLYDYLKFLETESSGFERERLLYVAATRAKKNLILSACVSSDALDSPPVPVLEELGKPKKGSLLYNAWPHLQAMPAALMTTAINTQTSDYSSATQQSEDPQADRAADSESAALDDESLAMRRFDHQTIAWLFERVKEQDKVSQSQRPDKLAVTEVADATVSDKGSVDTGANDCADHGLGSHAAEKGNASVDEWRRLAGMVFHELMMYLGRDRTGKIAERWRATGNEQEQYCLHFLRRVCLSERVTLGSEALALAKKQICDALENTLHQPNGLWLMSSSHSHRRCESAISWRDGGIWRESRIDLSFIDQDHVQWIIDFKLVDNPAISDQQMLNNYRSQLSHYQSLMSNAAHVLDHGVAATTEIKAALYLPLSDKLLILNEN